MTSPTVTIRGVEIGAGRPKIIVPLVSKDAPALELDAAALAGHPIDLVEWRIDHYAADAMGEAYVEEVVDGARLLRRALDAVTESGPSLPVLVTFRTAAEGGERAIDDADYGRVLAAVAASGDADLIDVEAFRDRDAVAAAIAAAHDAGVAVIGSNHDFDATPAYDEIARRLRFMQDLGADIAKIAVMPRSPEDVLTLLGATSEVAINAPRTPLITMSMGPLGVISRAAGATFGSACTFAAIGVASAPGQIGAAELAAAMDALAP